MEIETMGDRIRSRRLALNMTIADVAWAMDVSQGTVSKWENGQIQNLKCDKLNQLAAVLKVSTGFLIGSKDASMSPATMDVQKTDCSNSKEIIIDRINKAVSDAVYSMLSEKKGILVTETAEERELLMVYRKLDPHMRQKLMAMAMLLEG